MKKWQIISEEDVSPSKWFPVTKHVVKLPDGSIVDDYFFSPIGDVVMLLPITKDKKIVLVKQYKHGIREVVIELPAGYKKAGISHKQTAIEELEEEVGIKTEIHNLIDLGKLASNPTKLNNIVYGYLARNLEFNSKQNLEVTEDIEVLLATFDQVLKMIDEGAIWVSDSVAFILIAKRKFPKLF